MHRLFVPALLVLVCTAACSGDDDPSGPTAPSPVAITETMSGTVTVNGAVTHPFAVGDGGAVTATLTALTPDTTAVIGVSLGTWNGVTCQLVITNTNATQGAVVIGSASQSGNLCLYIQDVGKLTAPASYEVSVIHF